jgi:hypothetical protein
MVEREADGGEHQGDVVTTKGIDPGQSPNPNIICAFVERKRLRHLPA